MFLRCSLIGKISLSNILLCLDSGREENRPSLIFREQNSSRCQNTNTPLLTLGNFGRNSYYRPSRILVDIWVDRCILSPFCRGYLRVAIVIVNIAGKSASYVDDNKLYLSFPSTNITTAIDNLNEDLKNICVWCCKNSLLINLDKTKVLFIGVPQLLRQLPAVPVLMLGKEINPVIVAKDLGLYLDQSLTYRDHVSKTASITACTN